MIRQIKPYRWIALGTLVSMVALGASQAAPATAPAPPPNDAYLLSLELNRPGTHLNRTSTLQDMEDTTGATVQTNIFDPCGQASCPAGPAEITTCNGVTYANTVWYDFYPDANGTVSIRTSGFDNVITLYRFDTHTLIPDAAHRECVHQSDFPSEQLVAQVNKGVAYTFQVGSAVTAQNPQGAGGQLQMQFDYFVPPPRSLRADSVLTARATSAGVELLGLKVSAPHRGARVDVDCGAFCAPMTEKTPRHGHTVLAFPRLKGIQMPAGSKLTIRVTAPSSIGVAIQYDILRGNFSRQTFCTEPGSRKLRRTCH